jgi:signal transduction histidine kinase
LIQESLANGSRHSGGSEHRVSMAKTDAQLTVSVSDNGAGFDPKTAHGAGRVGLEGMRERVEILGGSFQLKTAPGLGTEVHATLPLQLAGIDYE